MYFIPLSVYKSRRIQSDYLTHSEQESALLALKQLIDVGNELFEIL